MDQRHAVSSIGQLVASMRCGDEIVTGDIGANVTAAP
jgi:preprotein translocase subunit YajC